MSDAERLSVNDLVQGLRALGLRRGDVVEVHSSLSSLGWVEGGAATVVRALMEAVGSEGALVMPGYPFGAPRPLSQEDRERGVRFRIPLLDPEAPGRTGMGAVADAFRRWPGVVCGRKRFRVCAWGRDADTFSQGFGQLLARDGLALLIGVDIHCLSSMHQAEGEVGLPPEVARLNDLHEEADPADPANRTILSYGEMPTDAWAKVWAEARARGLIREGRIGQATCYLFRAAAVVGIYKEKLRADPYDLFGVEPDTPPERST
jgi:aminoglycoside N3'-acetyltransferase